MEPETYSDDGPECPYCGHQHNPSDDPAHYYDEKTDTSFCSSCGNEFRVDVYVSHSWSCTRLETATPSDSKAGA